jgi:hypothetical protein
VADFNVWHNARAVLDNGTVLEIDNLHTVTGVTHISRGLANMEEEGFAGMSGFPPAEAHVYLALAMVAGAGFLTWENGNADSLEVALAPGQTFELASWKSFDVSATAGDGTVTDKGLDVTMDAGRGVKFEYIILCNTQCPCCQIFFPEGCQHFSFDYDGATSMIIGVNYEIADPTGYTTVIPPDGIPITLDNTDAFQFSGDGHQGSYCVYSSDIDGNPVADEWVAMSLLGSPIGSIANVDVSGVNIVSDPLSIDGISFNGAVFTEDPDFGYMTQCEWISFQSCTMPSVPVTSAMPQLKGYVLGQCGLSVAPTYTGLPLLEQVGLNLNNLPVSEVNKVLEQGSATFTGTSGIIDVSGQTPAAPPSGAGLTAKAELEGRSPGWNVTTD